MPHVAQPGAKEARPPLLTYSMPLDQAMRQLCSCQSLAAASCILSAIHAGKIAAHLAALDRQAM